MVAVGRWLSYAVPAVGAGITSTETLHLWITASITSPNAPRTIPARPLPQPTNAILMRSISAEVMPIIRVHSIAR